MSSWRYFSRWKTLFIWRIDRNTPLKERGGILATPADPGHDWSPVLPPLRDTFGRWSDDEFAWVRSVKLPYIGTRPTELVSAVERESIQYGEWMMRLAGELDGIDPDRAQTIRRLVHLVQKLFKGFVKTQGYFDTHGTPEVVNLNEAIEEVLSRLRFTSLGDQLVVGFKTEESGTLVKIDPSLLELVWNNLLRNAAEAVGEAHLEGIPLTITLQREGAYVSATVADQGPGISPEILPSVFQTGVSTKGQQRGIGLNLVREIVENAGGTIEVSSRHISQYPSDHGTTFTIRMPIAAGMEETVEKTVRRLGRSQESLTRGGCRGDSGGCSG